MAHEDANQPAKRIKLSSTDTAQAGHTSTAPSASLLASLHRPISPPLPSSTSSSSQTPNPNQPLNSLPTTSKPKLLSSPFQLTHIRDLGSSSANNVDTVRLRDLLGDPMIRECWQFNYLFDVDFLMQQFDEDVRALVDVKVVHGSWKREAPNRVRVDEACSRYPNVEPIVAYMPEAFGTHHSKMMILLRHDDLAQVIIHTANMIPGDWENMCQAVWSSPLLPLQTQTQTQNGAEEASTTLGTGSRFKRDLLAYLSEYGPKKTGRLVDQLRKFDFGSVRAALVASVPSKQKFGGLDSSRKTVWGWPALRDVLGSVPIQTEINQDKTPHVVCQMSSIASLGQTDKWLKDVFFRSLSLIKSNGTGRKSNAPKYSIIFPTADEIRRSLNGYGSGGSIHMKIQSVAQQKQLQYMRPYLRHWAGDAASGSAAARERERDAGRRRAAPHIKTYIRFSNQEMNSIDWAMLTSANLSTQAWGAGVNANDEVRICSWEIGVVVWPDLFAEDADRANGSVMVPCFKTDVPESREEDEGGKASVRVGLRMPYGLPLVDYAADEKPWCATASHSEPDWMGQTWMDDPQ
ncbi:tyrosyl-DNA phosphodiesterase 1 [Aspergillus melleus]|uniref:tyrosyl-DNA phosphodiesterase 1 n=1 Tax=Aspergillus melleus TaxID=138277 RepID=UPI001E8CBD2D|nr:uncharacterized protein LDX57_002342 [Aspergillus melleus]KAH8424596.1 hypothetical protein LDX57_002342 [Aspergillus melleus]